MGTGTIYQRWGFVFVKNLPFIIGDDDDDDAPDVPLVKRRFAAWQPFFFAPHYTSASHLHSFHPGYDEDNDDDFDLWDYDDEKGSSIRLHDDGRKSGLQVKGGRG